MAYVRCAYAPILEEVLRQPLQTGQGGHWEASPANVYLALVRLEGSLSSFLAREIKQTFGAQSRDIIQNAATAYGRYRGEAIRRRVEKLGLPLDIPRMWNWWDLPVTSARDDERMNDDLSLYYHGFEVPNCPFNDVYQLYYPTDLRALHCEAMHTAAFQGYNPSIDFWMPALMPRGEGRCVFRLRIPLDEAEKIERRATAAGEPARGMDDTTTSYRLVARQVVIIYHFFTDALLSACGPEQTENVLRRAMASWGAWRGREMQATHMEKGWPLNLETFITYYDDPAAENGWVAENVHLAPAEHHKEIVKSAFSDYFVELATGPLAAVFFEETLPAQAGAYNPKIKMTIPRLMERGDAISEFHYVIAE
jgi:hypothetical protein